MSEFDVSGSSQLSDKPHSHWRIEEGVEFRTDWIMTLVEATLPDCPGIM
jgi:hypothetical protein